MDETAVRTYKPAEVVNIEDYAMSVEGITHQVQLIQDVMKNVMRDGEHYGIIPGTNKPTLLKPGAEKLCLTFRLDPKYDIIREIREKEFIAYTVKCDLVHIPTTQHIAVGLGSCNSRETKYRYRNEFELTENPVPKSYWDARNSNNSKEMKRLLNGHVTRKNEENGQWVLAKTTRVENDNPWDLDNTLIKMACKRALVAATLNATAASDIFTQDIEDMPPGIVGGNKKPKAKSKPKPKKEIVPEPENGSVIQEQLNAIYDKGADLQLSKGEVMEIGKWFRKGDKMTSDEANHLIKNFGKVLDDYLEFKSQQSGVGDDIPY